MSRSIDDDSLLDDEVAHLRIENLELDLSATLDGGADFRSDSDVGSQVPVAGRLVWVTPGGTIRELDPTQLSPRSSGADTGESGESDALQEATDGDLQEATDDDLQEAMDDDLQEPMDDAPREPTADRSCTRCGEQVSVETLVREHADCGYVGFDGFVRAEDGGRLACPKCGTEDRTGEEFSVVATVHSCVRCGQTMDRPLGRTDDGP